MKANRPETGLASNRSTALGMLVLIYMSSYLDRQILSILLPQIKAEFDVPDTYLGLLTGLAFAVFYTLLGVPLARLADNYSRVNLLTICITAWSLMTALCGMAVTFSHLVFARIGVGIGEAGCNPAAHSLISDYFPFERRASALATYAIAVPLGSLLGLALGGWVGQEFGWRVAFLAVGLPGLLLALLTKLVLKEPPRGMADGKDSTTVDSAPPLGETFSYLWKTKTFRALCVAAAADAFVGYGLLLWLPTYLIRSFVLTAAETGLRLGLMVGISGVIGSLGVGFLTDRLGKKDRRFYCWVPAIVVCVALVGNITAYSALTATMTFLLLLIPLLMLPATAGPTYAVVQSIAPPRMRATAASVLLLVLNLVGLGLGPVFVGLMSDVLAGAFGTDSLRIAMQITAGVYLISMVMYYQASRFFIRDLKRAEVTMT